MTSYQTLPSILYHGTSSKNLHGIIRANAILPRKELVSLSNWDECPSSEHAVYLTTQYPYYFANAATSDEDAPVILEINSSYLKYNWLAPDEDAVEQVLRHKKVPEYAHLEKEYPDMRDRTKYIRDNIWNYAANGCSALWSIRALGTCAYYEKIPIKAIGRVAVFKPQKDRRFPWSNIFDPTITIMNNLVMGEKYHRLSQRFFDKTQNVEFVTQYGISEKPWPTEAYEDFEILDFAELKEKEKV